MEKVNVQQLVEELAAQAAAEGLEDACAPAPGEPLAQKQPPRQPVPVQPRYVGRFNRAAYLDEIAGVTARWNVPQEGPLPGGLKGFFLRIVRKCIRFYAAPSRAAQNAFNERVTAALNELAVFVDDAETAERRLFETPMEQALYDATAAAPKAIARLEKEAAALRAENADLKTRLEALEQALQGLQEGNGGAAQ